MRNLRQPIEPGSQVPSQDRATALVAIRKRLSAVRVRFNVTLDDMASRVFDVAQAQRDPAVALDAFVKRLSLDDLYLATACARGEERAWDELGSRFFSFIRDFSRRALREPAASDVADQVIADLWQRRKIARYEGRSTLRTWLGAVVAHADINAAKQKTPDPLGANPDRRSSLAGRDPADALAGKEAGARLASWVAKGIEELPASDRLLILLYYEQNLTLEQISASVGGSKATLSRILTQIRRRLCEYVEAAAATETGDTPEALRGSIDFGRLELDLSAVLARPKRSEGNLV